MRSVSASRRLDVLHRENIQALDQLRVSAGQLERLDDISVGMAQVIRHKLARTIQERWPGIGVIISSGRERPGPDDLSDRVAFLAKPYLPDTVISLIRQMATPQ